MKETLEPKIKFDGENFAALKMQFADQVLFQGFTNPKLNKQFEDSTIIYHYANVDTFFKIIEGQSLYFTNLFYLNDKVELKHGIGLIKKSLIEIKPRYPLIVDLIYQHLEKKITTDKFVFCTSKNGDLLEQWRAYGDNGRGVSIGFKNHNLKSCLYGMINGTHLDYDESYQISKFQEITNQHISFFEKYKDEVDWGKYRYEEMVAISVMEFSDFLLDSTKHSSFVNENEYRLTYKRRDNARLKIEYRDKGKTKIPFINIPTKARRYKQEKEMGMHSDMGADPVFVIDKLPIEKIILGPCFDEMELTALKKQLFVNGYSDVQIIKSDLPYRVDF